MAASSTEDDRAADVLQRQDSLGRAEAVRRVGVQRRIGDLGTELRAGMETRFAGAWFSDETGTYEVGYVTPADAALGRAVVDKHRGLQDGDVKFDQVDDTFAELVDQVDAVRTHVAADSQEISTSIDVAANTAVVSLNPGRSKRDPTAMERDLRRDGYKAVVRRGHPEMFGAKKASCYFPACDRPIRGGVDIKNEVGDDRYDCSAGFGATDGSTFFVLTAGHCVHLGTIYQAVDRTSWTWQSLGWADAAFDNQFGDAMRIDTTGSYFGSYTWPPLVAAWGVDEEYDVLGSAWSDQGGVVCKAGERTGLTCGTVVALHQNGSLTEATGACAEAGDSGGSVIAYDYARGLVSPSSDAVTPWDVEYCTDATHYMWYTEVKDAEFALGVSVVHE